MKQSFVLQLILRLKEVIAVTKEKTALVIPNAIEIKTEKEKHFFTSFGARDKAYAMMYKLWLNSMRTDEVNIVGKASHGKATGYWLGKLRDGLFFSGNRAFFRRHKIILDFYGVSVKEVVAILQDIFFITSTYSTSKK
jgi:hypothetical protein